MMTIIVTAIHNSFTPYMYKNIKGNNLAGIRKNSKPVILIVGLACVAAMVFGPEIIAIFADKEYYEAVWVTPPWPAPCFLSSCIPCSAMSNSIMKKPVSSWWLLV